MKGAQQAPAGGQSRSVTVVGWLDEPGGHYAPYAKRTLRAIIECGVRVKHVLTDHALVEELSRAVGKGVRVDSLPPIRRAAKGSPWPLKSFGYRLSLLRRLIVARSIFREAQDATVVLLATDIPTFALAGFALGRRPVLAVVHNIAEAERTGSLLKRAVWRLVLRLAARQATRLVVLDDAVAERIRELVGRRMAQVVVVPDYRETPGARTDSARKGPAFLFLGVLAPEKGVDVLLDAWAQAHASLGGAHLTIAGAPCDRPYGEHIANRVEQLKQEGITNISLVLRALSDSEYFGQLDKADYVVLPYLDTAGTRSSGVLMDALAAGKTVLISTCKAFSHYVSKGEFPGSFPPGNATELGAVLLEACRVGYTPSGYRPPTLEDARRAWISALQCPPASRTAPRPSDRGPSGRREEWPHRPSPR